MHIHACMHIHVGVCLHGVMCGGGGGIDHRFVYVILCVFILAVFAQSMTPLLIIIITIIIILIMWS